MTSIKMLPRLLAYSLLGILAGCGHSPPPLVEVEGTVLLNGQPLPNAYIEFVPELAHFGAEMNSTATTDEAGKFRLTCNKGAKPGAVVAKHWVLVNEIAAPLDRRDREEAARGAPPSEVTLANRPIPPEYGAVSTTPLRLEVTKEGKSYLLQLTRKS